MAIRTSSGILAAVTSPVDAVVFDIGGVLLDWQPSRVYAELIPDPDELAWFLANVCTTEWNLSLDAGRDFEEACTTLAAEHPDQAERIHAWKRQDEMIAGELAEVVALVDRLAERGVPRYLLTNMPADVFAARVERYPVLQRFHGAVVSGEEGVLKPSAEIFHLVRDRFGLDPAATLFVDDSAVNVEGARAVGFRAHRFVDGAGLEAELRALDLL